MPFGNDNLLVTLVMMFLGSSIFLRIVAREKVRREKHLELRYFEKIQEAEAEHPEERPKARRELKTLTVHE